MELGRDGQFRIFLYVFEDLRSHTWVLLDHSEFLIGQRCRFVDDAVWNTDLADIMEKAHHVDLFLTELGISGMLGDPSCIFRHTSRMTSRIDVLCIDRGRQGLDDVDQEHTVLLCLHLHFIAQLVLKSHKLDDVLDAKR